MFKISKISVPKPRAYWLNFYLQLFSNKNIKEKMEKRKWKRENGKDKKLLTQKFSKKIIWCVL